MNASTSPGPELLERSLATLRDLLRSDIECAFLMEGARVEDSKPVPGSGDVESLRLIVPVLDLVRDIEAAIGRPVEHPEPQWLDDLLDGKWGLR